MSKEHKPLPYDARWVFGEIETWKADLNARKRSDMENAAQVLGRLRGIKDVNLEKLHIDLAEVNLQAMRLSGLDFDDAGFHNASLDGAELNWVALNGAKLNEAKLNRAALNGAKLTKAWLIGVVLHGAELQWAELNEAKLNGAKLNGANLTKAWLIGAVLYGTELDENTDIRAVRAKGSALMSVDLKEVKNLQYLLEGSFGDGTVELPKGTPWPKKWPKHELASLEFYKEWEKFKADPKDYIPPEA